MVANIKEYTRMLDEKGWEEFITWLRDHTGQEIVQEGKLDGRLAEWLQAFDLIVAEVKYRLILNEIKWLQHKQKTEKVKREN
jgi:hypothetical protein